MGSEIRAGPASRGEDARWDRLLGESARLLNSNGVSGDFLAQAAGALGLTRAALYGYVEDREDLVFRCYQRSCEIMSQRLEEAISGGENVFGVIEAFVRKVLDPALPELAALSETGYLRPSQERAILSQVDALERRLAEVLAVGGRSGLIRTLDYAVVGRALLSLVYWLKLAPRWLSEEVSLPAERLQATALRLIFDGLATGQVTLPSAQVDLTGLVPQITDAFDRKSMTIAKRDKILATASRLFNTRGLDSTSVDEIAAQVGATKRTIYNHFADKQGLVSACQLRGYAMFTEIVEQARSRQGSRAEVLAFALYASVMASSSPALSPLRVFSGLPDLGPGPRQAARDASTKLQRCYEEIFQQGAAEGSMQEVDLRATLLAMTGASTWVARSDLDTETFQQAHVAREIAGLLLMGLRARPANRPGAA